LRRYDRVQLQVGPQLQALPHRQPLPQRQPLGFSVLAAWHPQVQIGPGQVPRGQVFEQVVMARSSCLG